MKTKSNLFKFCLLGAVLLLPTAVQAQFTFTINADNTLTLTGYTGTGGAVIIPDTTNGMTITSIGVNAFYRKYSLTSVTIGNSVTNIGSTALYHCTNLTNVTIGNSVTTIRISTFYYCIKLISVTIGNGVTSIEPNALGSCSNLTNLTLGNSVTNIWNSAFQNCTSLKRVTIPNSITSISIGTTAFSGCSSLKSMTDDMTTIGREFSSIYSLTHLIIGDHATTVSSGAFDHFGSLVSLTIGNSVTSIGNSAFHYCSGLTSVTIGNSVTNIGSSAFQICSLLRGVYFRGNAPSLGSFVFTGDTNATVYYLPGTTGWDNWVSPPPAVLWNPQAQTGDGSFGVQTNQFGFNITGTTNIPIVVEACTNLANSGWMPLQTCKLTNGSIYFSDPQWTNYPGHFYRLRSP